MQDSSEDRRDVLARLVALQGQLEAKNKKGADWSMARSLEDRIGSEHCRDNDLEEAAVLLRRHGLKVTHGPI